MAFDVPPNRELENLPDDVIRVEMAGVVVVPRRPMLYHGYSSTPQTLGLDHPMSVLQAEVESQLAAGKRFIDDEPGSEPNV